MIPQPPANGRKLWRVPRKPLSTSNPVHNSSRECLENSLKIVAAGKAYSTKRPPLRRPKNQPGKPKDFVFVDLSPVRSDEEVASKKQKVSTSTSSVTAKSYPANVSPISEASNDTFSISSDEESMFSLYDSSMNNANNDFNNFINQQQPVTINTSTMPLFTMPEAGLGLSMDDFQFDMSSFNSQFNAYPYPQQAQQQDSIKTPYMSTAPVMATPERRRAASTSFEYKTPSPKKPTLNHRHTITEITPNTQGLEAFMMFNDQMPIPYNNHKEIIPEFTHTTVPRTVAAAADAFDMNVNNQYSPITDDSEVEDFQNTKLGKAIEFSSYDNSMLQKQQTFDLSAFVAF
ncbi:hypothetical protein CLIB1423_03S00188 [[Candida] railenensis]|uniref:Uncharacterized protein n=1 Tax=[Candida] railenensis TaxID=45579 RepID=A0A9P0VWS0_9ASCO|nr:hypothetical protein CLIB1423_03S00188 [[Candida] railenensis]